MISGENESALTAGSKAFSGKKSRFVNLGNRIYDVKLLVFYINH